MGSSLAAQDTDAAQKVNEALTAYGPVPVTVVTQTPRQVEFCPGVHPGGNDQCVFRTVYDTSSKTTSSILVGSNVRTVKSSAISWGQVTQTQLPDQMIVADALYQNCNTTTLLTANISISRAFQRSSSLTLTHQVTHTQGSQINGSIKIPGDVFTVGAQVTDQNSVMDGTATIKGDQQTVTQTVSGSQVVNSQSSMVAEEQIWPVRYTIEFTATVTVDADLSKNDKGFGHLSDIMSETDRTFTVSGLLSAYDASQATLKTFAYPYDPSTCKSGSGLTVVEKFIPKPKIKLYDASQSLIVLPEKK
jgi:hypothetical protein